jgi:predicted nucleic acid-binding protein
MSEVGAVHLDTSFLIRALLPGTPESTRLEGWFVGGHTLVISAMAWAEFLSGPLDEGTLGVAGRLVGEAAPITGLHAEHAARLYNLTGRRRSSLPDCLIAAAAIDANAPLATADPHFSRFAEAGLHIVTH